MADDMMALYERAVRASYEAAIQSNLEDFAVYGEQARVKAKTAEEATAALLKTALEGLDDKVMEAARAGETAATLLEFEGSERFDEENSLLYLVKGPRREGKEFFTTLGVIPFVDRLQLAIQPFRVQLTYDQETNMNFVSAGFA